MQTYDLTVMMDEDGDPILRGSTKAGEIYVDSIRGGANAGDDLVIACSVNEFMNAVPKNLVVGFVDSQTGFVQKLCRTLLH